VTTVGGIAADEVRAELLARYRFGRPVKPRANDVRLDGSLAWARRPRSASFRGPIR